MKQRFRVNNKEKQAVSSNWGKPKDFEQKNTNIPDPLYPVDRHKGVKRNRKKRVFRYSDEVCPFCDRDLPRIKLTGEEMKQKTFYVEGISIIDTMRGYKINDECTCGALRANSCPCCKRKTWFKDGVYKHQPRHFLGCGFTGERRRSDD
jgi:hypothetical protein